MKPLTIIALGLLTTYVIGCATIEALFAVLEVINK